MGSGGTLVADRGGGWEVVFERDDDDRWEEIPSPTSASLFDVSLGQPDVAVGKAGTVIERSRGIGRDAGDSPDGDGFDGRGETDDGDDTAPGEDRTGNATDESGESRSDERIVAEIVSLLEELADGDDDGIDLSELL